MSRILDFVISIFEGQPFFKLAVYKLFNECVFDGKFNCLAFRLLKSAIIYYKKQDRNCIVLSIIVCNGYGHICAHVEIQTWNRSEKTHLPLVIISA